MNTKRLTDQQLENLPVLINRVKKCNEAQVSFGITIDTPEGWSCTVGASYGRMCDSINAAQNDIGTEEAIINTAIETATLSLKMAEMYLKVQADRINDGF